MSDKIDLMYPISGRHIKEDGDVVNLADILDKVYDSENEVLKTSANIEVGDVEIGAVEIKDSTSETRAVVGPNGLQVDIQNRTLEVTFHDGSDAPGNGTAQSPGAYSKLKVEISSSAQNSARTISFKEKMTNGTLIPISGVKRNGLTVATSTTGTDEVWEFSVVGGHEIVMDLTAITGGEVYIKGTFVA